MRAVSGWIDFMLPPPIAGRVTNVRLRNEWDRAA